MYVMCFLLVVLNIDIIFTCIIPTGVYKSPYAGDHIDLYAVHSDGVVAYHGIHHHGSYGNLLLHAYII